MSTLFIADLHLSAQQPVVTAGFLHFLQREAIHADALYILGDLFESWVGDDDPEPLHGEIATALQALHQSGVPCYFIHGNRDFMIGKRFAQRCGITLLPEEHVVELYGRRILIMHGDTLCTDDKAYQEFRSKVHKVWLQKLFLVLPLRWRLKFGAGIRGRSQQGNQYKSAMIMDVNSHAVEQTMSRHHAQWLIHGHTHRPAVHHHGEGVRMVLGAWHEEGSMIKVTAENLELMSFKF